MTQTIFLVALGGVVAVIAATFVYFADYVLEALNSPLVFGGIMLAAFIALAFF